MVLQEKHVPVDPHTEQRRQGACLLFDSRERPCAEKTRVSAARAVLGELNTAQVEAWQRTVEVVTERGERRQMRLFATEQGLVAANEDDVAHVMLSSLCVRRPREFGACWVALRM